MIVQSNHKAYTNLKNENYELINIVVPYENHTFYWVAEKTRLRNQKYIVPTCLSFMWYRNEPPYVFWSKGQPSVWITAPGLCFSLSISQTWNHNGGRTLGKATQIFCHEMNSLSTGIMRFFTSKTQKESRETYIND